MWGQVPHFTSAPIKIRIIPTRVGTRRKGGSAVSPTKDHPHACGDKVRVAIGLGLVLGSSPRVWGQVVYYRITVEQDRIIPTRVGTSLRQALCRSTSRDHPHACGDKKSLMLQKLPRAGSSPRVWGQDPFFTALFERYGIIPTRVGTRKSFPGLTSYFQDHPHACGDKQMPFKISA